MTDLSILQPLLGVILILMVCILCSEKREDILYTEVLKGLGIELALCGALLKMDFFQDFFSLLNVAVTALQKASAAGTSMVFGYLGGAPLPFSVSNSASTFILGFQALPMILIFSALSSLLYHWRILPWVVNACAWALGKVFKIKGATSFACVATVFVGMVQAPLLVRPYLKSLGRSELFVIMNSGMATISGTVLIIYANMLQNVVANASTHLFIACIVNALSAVILSLIVIPHLPMERQAKQVHLEPQDNRLLVDIETQKYHSSMQAIAEGTQQGIKLLGNVLAMLIVLVALVSLTNALLECLPNVSEAPITLQRVAALVMQPLAWCLGVPWQDTPLAAELMGTKLVLNEFVAYVNLSHYPMDAMQDKTKILLTYVLCGFANFGSLGILIAGLGAMLPERQKDIIDMGLRSLIVGTLSTCLTAAMASLILFTHL